MSDERAAGPGWQLLRELVTGLAPELSVPAPGLSGCCAVCRGPAGGVRSIWCYQCSLHSQCAPGSLADAVLPVAFAVKGSAHASRLWQYKSARVSAGTATRAALELLALLLVFLREHGGCACAAGGFDRPTHLAAVPSSRGRPGPHPLRALVAPYLTSPWAELAGRPGWPPARDLDPDRFRVFTALPGARVLLLDDTWTTGASAQSAAMALRAAGARSVVTVVLGRHVSAPPPGAAPFLLSGCAVHGARNVARSP